MTQIDEIDAFISYCNEDQDWVKAFLTVKLEEQDIRVKLSDGLSPGFPRIVEIENFVRFSNYIILIISPSYISNTYNNFIGLLSQTISIEANDWRIIPLIIKPSELPVRLSILSPLDATNSDDWQDIIDVLIKRLKLSKKEVPELVIPCPYPGMLPFKEEQSELFFGREREVATLIKRISKQKLIFITGRSGCGKSSMIFAGLIPSIQKRFANTWLVRAIRLGDQPLLNLKNNILDIKSENSLHNPDIIQKNIIIIDQFEEIFLNIDKYEQGEVISEIKTLISSDLFTLIFIFRIDFYEDVSSIGITPEFGNHIPLEPLKQQELRKAIVKPAEKMGCILEKSLIERILIDADNEAGILPLVQETMVWLWEKMQGKYISLDDYIRMGEEIDEADSGLSAIISIKCDTTLSLLYNEEQKIAYRIFIRLIQLNEDHRNTRRQLPIKDLMIYNDDEAIFQKTLNHLINNRLLVTDFRNNEKKVDITHEIIIKEWKSLNTWITNNRDIELKYRRLESRVDDWMRLGKAKEGLLYIHQLEEVNSWIDSDHIKTTGVSININDYINFSKKYIEHSNFNQYISNFQVNFINNTKYLTNRYDLISLFSDCANKIFNVCYIYIKQEFDNYYIIENNFEPFKKLNDKSTIKKLDNILNQASKYIQDNDNSDTIILPENNNLLDVNYSFPISNNKRVISIIAFNYTKNYNINSLLSILHVFSEKVIILQQSDDNKNLGNDIILKILSNENAQNIDSLAHHIKKEFPHLSTDIAFSLQELVDTGMIETININGEKKYMLSGKKEKPLRVTREAPKQPSNVFTFVLQIFLVPYQQIYPDFANAMRALFKADISSQSSSFGRFGILFRMIYDIIRTKPNQGRIPQFNRVFLQFVTRTFPFWGGWLLAIIAILLLISQIINNKSFNYPNP